MSAVNITIPEVLVRQVQANPGLFQPSVRCADRVLILDGLRGAPGSIGTAEHRMPLETASLTVRVGDRYREAFAWALVRNPGDFGKAPLTIGARVLVLRTLRVSAAVGLIGTVIDCGLGRQSTVDFGVEVPADDGELDRRCVITQWAVLPPAAEEPLIPEMPDMPSQTVNIEPDRRASVAELADVLATEFGGHRPGETSIRAAIRILREQRDQIQRYGDGGTNG